MTEIEGHPLALYKGSLCSQLCVPYFTEATDELMCLIFLCLRGA